MRILALLENTPGREDVRVEHGLSLYVETDRHRILFDMGQTDLFAQNAATLGVDLSTVDLAVLSHGHYDHGGGLDKFLEINRHAPVYIHRDAFLPHYNGTEKYIGLDPRLCDHPRILFTEDHCPIDGSLSLFTCNGVLPPQAETDGGLTERVGDLFVPDDFRHEQYLLIRENGRQVLISGCSHKGILAIGAQVSPDVLVGGFHFSKRPLDEQLAEDAQRLASLPTVFYTCHCTGREQYAFMKQYIPQLHYLSCGQIIDI